MSISSFIFHGTWAPFPFRERFFVWAEDAYRFKGKRRRTAQKSVPRHPFQAPLYELALLLPDQADMDCTMLLPTVAGAGPLPSPELRVSGPADNPSLAPWTVTGLSLKPAAALSWLATLPATPAAFYHAYGADLRLWSTAAKLVLELLVRGRLLPTMDPERAEARWQLLLTEAADQERVQALADALPPVCQALLPPKTDPADFLPAGALSLVTGFMNVTADALIRQWLNGPSAADRARSGKLPRAGAEWLAALAAPTPNLLLGDDDLGSLRQAIQAWTQPTTQRGAPAAFRTCLRLEAPTSRPPSPEGREDDAPEEDSPDAPWVLRLLLQASDDPSLLVPATEVWRERGATLRYLNRRFDQPQERLLTDLGVAARLFPPLARSLRAAHPDECALSPAEAHLFLKEGALLLQESGLGVLLPSNWNGDTRIKVRLRVKSPRSTGVAGLGLADLLAVDWDLLLGDQPLSRSELERLARLKVPLVRLRGQWVELDPQRLAAALDRLERQSQITVGAALRLSAGAGELAPGLPVAGVAIEGAAGDLLRRLTGAERLAELAPPAALHGQLRPYQVRGFSWLAFLRGYGIGACLADDMGLGKTVQVIALLLHDRTAGQGTADASSAGPVGGGGRRIGPALLVCPTSLVGNWQREIARFAPSLRVMVHHGATRLRGAEFAEAAAAHDVVISTYALAHRDVGHLAEVRWDGIILDEAQNIKNADTRQSQSLRSLPAGYRIALTGTPVENRLTELWSILDFLNPGYLGSAAEFYNRFAVPVERYQDAAAAARLRGLVQPFILRRVKTDPTIIADLPEKLEQPVYVNLTPEQATLYAALVEAMLAQINAADGIQRRGLVLAALSKLKQVCNHPAQFLGDGSPLPGRSGKLNRLAEMLEEVLAEGDRALIFTQFAEMGTLLQQYLMERFGSDVLFLHGRVSQAERSRMVERFQEAEDGPALFILSLKAGGVGLNLTRANHVFHFDRWWNPAVENQATDRAFRIGQQKNVMVHKFIAAGTVEEKIDAIIAGKRHLASQVVGTGEQWLTELSTDQLRALFALEQE